MLTLNNLEYRDNGTKLVYDYTVLGDVKKFFNFQDPYYIKFNDDVSQTPKSIAVIPFLANMLPIAWFGNFNISVEELDQDFYDAISKLKTEFQKQYPTYELTGEILVNKKVKNVIAGGKSAMLFSGGVDAYATYIRNFDKTPDLVTIHGADIEIEDKKQWSDFVNFVETENLLKRNNKKFIETNVRTFYTYHVELLLKDLGWWGKVQHGLSLIGSLAPLAYVNNYASLFIASSYTDFIDIAWGSTPAIDQSITWAGITVHHDGYELKRQDKVDLITQFSKEKNVNFKLRVCYSELRDEFNCSNCEKCFRTILGIILNGEDPNTYGFNVDGKVYQKLFRVLQGGSASKGQQYFWWELMEKSKTCENPFIFEDSTQELNALERIKTGEIHNLLESKIQNQNKTSSRIKFILMNKFSSFYKFYRNLRK